MEEERGRRPREAFHLSDAPDDVEAVGACKALEQALTALEKHRCLVEVGGLRAGG